METESNFSSAEHAFALRWSKKIKAINILGGKCSICGNSDIRNLVFHHLSNKEYEIGGILKYRWSSIEKEIMKCKLLCANCHGEIHYKGENHQVLIKQKIISFYGKDFCNRCNYNKNVSCLDFHHVFNKSFMLSKKRSINGIIEELEKCELLCRNCHMIEHVDSVKFEKLKILISFKEKHKEISKPINPQEVKRMLELGMKKIEIAKYFGCAKSTISGVYRD